MEKDVDSFRLQHPHSDKAKKATVVSHHGDLAVVDDPHGDGFTVAIPAAGLALSAYRFATAAAAASVADDLAGAADFATAATRDGRAALYTDLTLASRVREVVLSSPDRLDVHVPEYPVGDRTGASYEDGYDERRRAAKRKKTAKE